MNSISVTADQSARIRKLEKQLSEANAVISSVQFILSQHVDDNSIDGGVLDDLCGAMDISIDDLPLDLSEDQQEAGLSFREQEIAEYLKDHNGFFIDRFGTEDA